MRKFVFISSALLFSCALLVGFWFFRAYHLKHLIVKKIDEKKLLEYTTIESRGFPLKVIVDLKNPSTSDFSLEGTLSIGSSLFAKKGWVETAGVARVFFRNQEWVFSGSLRLVHHNLWKLIRKRGLISSLSKETIGAGIAELVPKCTLSLDQIALNLEGEKVLSVDLGSLSIQSNAKGAFLTHTLKSLIKGCTIHSRWMRKYYFSDRMDVRSHLVIQSTSDSIFPLNLEVQKFVITDAYFRHHAEGTLALAREDNQIEGDLFFSLAQDVKRGYSPLLQKEHLRSMDFLKNIKLPDRSLFKKIQFQGNTHFQGVVKGRMFEQWEMDLKQGKLKFGPKYEWNMVGSAKGPAIQATGELEFLNYPVLKRFIEKKYSRELLPALLFIEELSTSKKENCLSFPVNYRGRGECTLGNVSLDELIPLIKNTLN